MKILNVELFERSYPIMINADLLNQGEAYFPYLHGRQVMIVTDPTVNTLYADKVAAQLKGLIVERLILPPGEQAKTLTHVSQIWDALLAANFNRQATLIALGGGIIGDMTGFAAACYQRGISLIQMPTTLLAQVDSSVGGKTGVNHMRGKNMLGAFWQPNAVVIDTATLSTLPARELSAGLAEIIKYALIADESLLTWLEKNMSALLARDTDVLTEAIWRSCQIKAAIVSADETELGARALLNFGHTFAHAIETETGYGSWLHGEAVAVGILLAARTSQLLGKLTVSEVARIAAILQAAKLPLIPPETMGVARFVELMARDKKNNDNNIRLVLLARIGKGEIYALKSQQELSILLQQLLPTIPVKYSF